MNPNHTICRFKTECSIKYVNSIFINHIFYDQIMFLKMLKDIFYLSETYYFHIFTWTDINNASVYRLQLSLDETLILTSVAAY